MNRRGKCIVIIGCGDMYSASLHRAIEASFCIVDDVGYNQSQDSQECQDVMDINIIGPQNLNSDEPKELIPYRDLEFSKKKRRFSILEEILIQ